jgi:two-component system response regulator PilR (NtrC family)
MFDSVDKSILIVDDEAVMREFLSEVLEDFSVDKACDGVEAISKIKEKKYDLIITDMKMPGVSGEKVVEFVRETCPESKIIVISGYSSLFSVGSTMQHGVSAFLAKPFTIKQIRTEVEKSFATKKNTTPGG